MYMQKDINLNTYLIRNVYLSWGTQNNYITVDSALVKHVDIASSLNILY